MGDVNGGRHSREECGDETRLKGNLLWNRTFLFCFLLVSTVSLLMQVV